MGQDLSAPVMDGDRHDAAGARRRSVEQGTRAVTRCRIRTHRCPYGDCRATPADDCGGCREISAPTTGRDSLECGRARRVGDGAQTAVTDGGPLMRSRLTMSRGPWIFRRLLSLSGTVLTMALAAGQARAQTLPPGALEQLDHVIGSRIETFAILDTQSGASGGTYASKINDTDIAITRVTGRGDVGPKRADRGLRDSLGPGARGWHRLRDLRQPLRRAVRSRATRAPSPASPRSSAAACASRSGTTGASRRPSASSTRTARTTSTPRTTWVARWCSWPAAVARATSSTGAPTRSPSCRGSRGAIGTSSVRCR